MSNKKKIKLIKTRIEELETMIRELKAAMESKQAEPEVKEEKPALVSAPAQPKTARKQTAAPARNRKKKPASEAAEEKAPSGKQIAAMEEEVPVIFEPAAESAATETEPIKEAEATGPASEEKAEAKPQKRRRSMASVKAKKVPAKRKPPTMKPNATFVLYNCDENKSPASMYNRDNETFRNTQLGRRALWNKLKTEIAEGRIEVLEGKTMKDVRLEVADGDPETLSQYLKYGAIEKIEDKK